MIALGYYNGNFDSNNVSKTLIIKLWNYIKNENDTTNKESLKIYLTAIEGIFFTWMK